MAAHWLMWALPGLPRGSFPLATAWREFRPGLGTGAEAQGGVRMGEESGSGCARLSGRHKHGNPWCADLGPQPFGGSCQHEQRRGHPPVPHHPSTPPDGTPRTDGAETCATIHRTVLPGIAGFCQRHSRPPQAVNPAGPLHPSHCSLTRPHARFLTPLPEKTTPYRPRRRTAPDPRVRDHAGISTHRPGMGSTSRARGFWPLNRAATTG